MVEQARTWLRENSTLIYFLVAQVLAIGTVTAAAPMLLVLHAIDGQEITIAPHQITTLRAHRPDKPNKLFTNEVNCLVGLTDGKFVTVLERCEEVRALLERK